jgi:thiol-disulfide isomerase/thioredoxin
MSSWCRLALLVVLVSGCHRRPNLPDGDITTTLTVPPIAGTFDPTSLKGKPSLVLFVTPTCSHCLATIPRAATAAKAKDANVVAVFVAGHADNATGVVDHTKFWGPALVDDGTLRKRYHVESVPYTLVLARDGHAVDAFEGEQEESTLADALDGR